MKVIAARSIISSARTCSNHTGKRHLGVYAMGESWTGALGTGGVDSDIVGHEDEEDMSPPPLVYPGETTAIAAGWGHSALISDKKLMVSGRPQEFQALLRLKRLPGFVRQYAVNRSLRYNQQQHFADPTMVGRILSWMVGEELDGEDGPWAEARRNSVLASFSHIPLPDNDVPAVSDSNRVLDASAGLTAVIGESGVLYTFGTNTRGQCGVGEMTNNVWMPRRVVGLSTVFAHDGREKLEQENPIVSVALGLQHGLALDNQGNLFTWGKGERGQLGQGLEEESESTSHALRVNRFKLPSTDGSRRLVESPVVTKIAAGMNQSAALTNDNHVFVWGKNVFPPLADHSKSITDSHWPLFVQGLPTNTKVLDIACGSHHTAMLMEDGSVFAVGITSDTAQLVSEATEIIPPGVIDMPCDKFDAHFDRTTIIGRGGRQVLQVHLWKDLELQEYGVFTPPWVEHILQDDKRITEIQRGWLHTIVSTGD